MTFRLFSHAAKSSSVVSDVTEAAMGEGDEGLKK